MKVIHINTSSSTGGAAIAAYRHVEAMNRAGIHASLLSKEGNEKKSANVLGPHLFDRYIEYSIFKFMQYARLEYHSWSLMVQGYGIRKLEDVKQADVVYIHWINNFLNYSDIDYLISTKRKVVWFMHDMWPITGGCHHSLNCRGYQKECKKCPQLLHFNLISQLQLKKKISHWKNADNLIIATPSNWLAECVRKSSVFGNHQIVVCPNVIDTGVYYPQNKQLSRQLLGLNPKKKYILFGAAVGTKNVFKGMGYLYKALSQVDDSYEFIVMGQLGADYPQQLKSRTHTMGFVLEESMKVLIYNASDVFVITSIAENYPNMIIESMACGIPSVAFPVGGITDQITHKKTGYLAELYNENSVVDGIEWVLEKCDYSLVSVECVKFVKETCSYEKVLQNHHALLFI